MYDVLRSFALLGNADPSLPVHPPFDVEIVSLQTGLMPTASGLPLEVHRAVSHVKRTQIIIISSILVENAEWICGRYPELVVWLKHHHARGAMLCSACSGVLLLAETGLLDGLDATMHWAYTSTFQRNFPRVRGYGWKRC